MALYKFYYYYLLLLLLLFEGVGYTSKVAGEILQIACCSCRLLVIFKL